MMSFFEAVAVCFAKYGTLSGRASRAEYWWFVLFVTLSTIILNALVSAFMGRLLGLWAVWVYTALLVLPMLAVGARRLHDTGFSGWWQLLHITGLGALILLVWFLLPGQGVSNRYGDPVVIPD